MKREYLEDYEAKELSEYDRFAERVRNGSFNPDTEIYPPKARFFNIQKPIAIASTESMKSENIWAQVPFCGSLILTLPPFPPKMFEEFFFKISDIPKILDFVKETGKLQIALQNLPKYYEGLDYFDPIFQELEPPFLEGLPLTTLGDINKIQSARIAFYSIGEVSYLKEIEKTGLKLNFQKGAEILIENQENAYIVLKLLYPELADAIEDAMVDNTDKALGLFAACQKFVVLPKINALGSLFNFTKVDTVDIAELPLRYQPEKIVFPCEIGKFLTSKLTYAPLGLDACKELMYRYDAYDLRKVQEALNLAIVENNPQAVNTSANELSEILGNVWDDKTIPQRIKGLKIGIPLSMAAIGSVAAGPIGAVGGLLAGLGFEVLSQAIDLKTDGLSEKLAKIKTKSYQANVYDFKAKYKDRLVF